MDSTTRGKYTSLLEEDWLKLGYPSTQHQGTRDLHPLFQRTNPSRPLGAEHIWPQFKSEDKYNEMCVVMRPVLQLASNILETPKSLDFLYQVTFSPRTSARGQRSDRGRVCKEIGWTEHPSPLMAREATKRALRQLSRSLSFQIGDPEVNPDIRGAIAFTNPNVVGFGDGVKMNEVSGKSGMASVITLNEKFIKMLSELDAQEGDTTSQKMSLQLKIAITLCHEIAHALAFAVDSELLELVRRELAAFNQAEKEGRVHQWSQLETDEPFYRGERMAEIGNSWENQVFGGKIIWDGWDAREEKVKGNEPLFVSKWPSFLSRDDRCAKRGREKRTARKYLVPFHFIRNMHRKGFWDNVRSGDSSALYIKKTVGMEYLNDDPDLETLSIDSSQVDWPKDDDSGRVDRGRGERPVPDPSASNANETEHERFERELASLSGA